MSDDVGIQNAKEEIREMIEKCNKCGLCKELDPIFRIFREEALSSRGKAILFSKNDFDRSLFDNPLCGQCKEKCPFDVDIDNAVRKARQILNLKGKEHEKNKEFLAKIKNNENPFS